MLPVSLEYPFLIAVSVCSNIYFLATPAKTFFVLPRRMQTLYLIFFRMLDEMVPCMYIFNKIDNSLKALKHSRAVKVW